jgi:hypothetical protein
VTVVVPVARKSMSNEEGQGWRPIFRDIEEREDQSELGLAGWQGGSNGFIFDATKQGTISAIHFSIKQSRQNVYGMGSS